MTIDDSLIPCIDVAKCCLSKECMKICPRGAIKIVGNVAAIDRDLCDGDGLCLTVCPNDAIRLPGQ